MEFMNRSKAPGASGWSACFASILTMASAGAAIALAQDITELSLEDLMNVEVTSVSKKEQKLVKAGAAVYVITQEAIRRSGMTNIPDLLRMAPGVNVARITSNTWAISIRGFNERYSSKVLVLIDGRSVYTQEFSGVFWDQQSVPLEDIDRIEVIRGPGGTVWGANAVNGVINIITKSSQDTQGGLVGVGTGSQDSVQGMARYGGKAGNKATYRVYARYFNVENSFFADRSSAADGWHGLQGGFRTDWAPSSRDTLTVQGDIYQAGEGQTITTVLSKAFFETRTFNEKITGRSKNLLGKWGHTFSNGSETSLQISYSNVNRFDQGTDDQDTTDVDFQYHFKLGERHDVVAGVDYRLTKLDYRGLYNYSYDRSELSSNLFSTFIQDEIKLSGKVTLTVGSKLEHNSFTGIEFEPSAQLVWTPNRRNTLWFSAARAIRQPSWFFANSVLDSASFPLEGGGVGVFQLRGTHEGKAERLLDFEAGYRTQLGKRWSLDVTGFRSYYHQLASLETGTPFFAFNPAPPHLVIPATWRSLASARNYGGEAFINWQVTDRWRISPGYSFLQAKIRRDAASNDEKVEASAGNSPKHQVQLRSAVNLPHNLEWDTWVYYVGALHANLDSVTIPVDAYTRVDIRLGWRIGEFTELSVAGQNLLAPRHLEFPKAHQVNSAQVMRSVVGKITWRF